MIKLITNTPCNLHMQFGLLKMASGFYKGGMLKTQRLKNFSANSRNTWVEQQKEKSRVGKQTGQPKPPCLLLMLEKLRG